MNSVEEVKRLESELAKAREATKEHLLAEGRKIIDDLATIGFAYDLVVKQSELSHTNHVHGRTCSYCHKPGHTKGKCPENRIAETSVGTRSDNAN